ncbi:hypothetical protein [Tissierella sp.]|uniref:hypothetical protein n=1 Tax=Tissierella sp. TaxID=41274 RepID=UPI003035487A
MKNNLNNARDNFNQKWINILTEGELDRMIEFDEVLADAPCEMLAIMKFRRILREKRGEYITVEHLKYGNIDIEYLQEVLQELFLEPVEMWHIEYFYESAEKRGYKKLNDAMEELYRRHTEDLETRFLSIALTI